MKTILVDGISCYVLKNGTVLQAMDELLDQYPNPKIVLTGANDEQFKEFNLDQVKHDVFTLKHNPEKTDPEYYKILLAKYDLKPEDVVYFEHSKEAVESAQSVGITTYFYDHYAQDLEALKSFLDENL